MITVRKYRNGGKRDFSIQKSRANLFFVWEGAKCLRENLSTIEEAEHQINQIVLSRKKSALDAIPVQKNDGTTYLKSIKPMKKNVKKDCIECGKPFFDTTIQQTTKICSDECRKIRDKKSTKKYNDKYNERVRLEKLKLKEQKQLDKNEKNIIHSTDLKEPEMEQEQREGFAKGITDAYREQIENSKIEISNDVLAEAISKVLIKIKSGNITNYNFISEVFNTLISIDPKYKALLSEKNQEFVKRFQSTFNQYLNEMDFSELMGSLNYNPQTALKTEDNSAKKGLSISEKIKAEKLDSKEIKSEVEAYASTLAKVLKEVWERGQEDITDLMVRLSNLTPYSYLELVDVCNHYSLKVRIDKWSAFEAFLSTDMLNERNFFPSTEQKIQLKQVLKIINEDEFNLKSYLFDHFIDVKDSLKIANENVLDVKSQTDKLVYLVEKNGQTVNQFAEAFHNNISIENWDNLEKTIETKVKNLEAKVENLESTIKSLVVVLGEAVCGLQSLNDIAKNKKKSWF